MIKYRVLYNLVAILFLYYKIIQNITEKTIVVYGHIFIYKYIYISTYIYMFFICKYFNRDKT